MPKYLKDWDPYGFKFLNRKIQGDSYWSYQIPFISNWKKASDDERYWSDYRKNTGHVPRYPGRVYGSAGSAAVNEAISFGNKVYRNMYK